MSKDCTYPSVSLPTQSLRVTDGSQTGYLQTLTWTYPPSGPGTIDSSLSFTVSDSRFTYGNGLIVELFGGGVYDDTGTNLRTAPAAIADDGREVYTDDRWMVVDTDTNILYESLDDLATASEVGALPAPLDASDDVWRLLWVNGRLFLTWSALDATAFHVSDDYGRTWTQLTIDTADTLRSIDELVYLNGRYAAVVNNTSVGKRVIYTTTDLTSWTLATLPAGVYPTSNSVTGNLRYAGVAHGYFAMRADSDADGQNTRLLYSTDLMTFSALNPMTDVPIGEAVTVVGMDTLGPPLERNDDWIYMVFDVYYDDVNWYNYPTIARTQDFVTWESVLDMRGTDGWYTTEPAGILSGDRIALGYTGDGGGLIAYSSG